MNLADHIKHVLDKDKKKQPAPTDSEVDELYAQADQKLQSGDAEAAKAMLDALLKAHPTHYRSLMLQGTIACAKALFSKAEMYFRAALKTLPANVDSLEKAVALSQLREVLIKQGKHQEAKVFVKQLAQMNAAAGGERVSEMQIRGAGQPENKTGLQAGAAAMHREDKSLNNPVKSLAEVARVHDIKHMKTGTFWSKEELQERKIVFVGMKQREVLNAFREVRIKLLQKQSDANMVVMVSSLKGNGGGSFFAYNLAAVFALDPQKTALYVDCNPYESSADRYVDGVIDKGLSQYLVDASTNLEEIIYPSGVERVRVIPAGGTNESAAELFNSDRMTQFISEIKSRYPDRFIILDAPAIENATEARILARHCDQALLLVPFGKATQDEVLSGVEAIGKDKFSGLVFNN